MKKNQGFIKWIILIVVALIILGYFGIDVKQVVESPTTQSNLNYLEQVASWLWHNILKVPVTWIWENLILPLVVKAVQN